MQSDQELQANRAEAACNQSDQELHAVRRGKCRERRTRRLLLCPLRPVA